MKAAAFKAVGQPLIIEDRPDPKPSEGEVIVKVGRCGICSSDLHMTSGKGVTFPADSVLGHEYAGEIVEVGAGVSTLKIGERITAMPFASCGQCALCLTGFPLGCASVLPMMSGYAEYARMAERSSIKLPQSLSLADGALVEPLASSLHGVVMAALRPGAKVVVLGAGAIGLGAIFWARMSGARQVVTIARSERHKELAMQMGATHFFSQGEDLQRQVAAALGGPPEAVFECVGVPGSLSAAIELVATRGSIIVLGMCGVADPVIPFIAGMKSITMKFSAAYELRDFEAAADAIDRGAAAPRSMISETIPLRDLPLVFEQMRTTSRGCKVLVSPSE